MAFQNYKLFLTKKNYAKTGILMSDLESVTVIEIEKLSYWSRVAVDYF